MYGVSFQTLLCLINIFRCEDIATMLEDEIHNLHKNNQMKYKNQIRSRIFNLKDKKNPMLRGNLLLGIITPAKYVVI